MRFSFPLAGIPLVDRVQDHSSVPTKVADCVARSCGPGRPTSRRPSALPWTAASTLARWNSLASAACLLTFVGSLACPTSTRAGAVSQSAAEHSSRVPQANPFAPFVTEASKRFAVPEQWIRAVMHVESGNDPQAVSPTGAMGLMQIMPDTWAELRGRYNLGANPFDPRDSISAGAAYLREMHERYGTTGFLAAYNAGPARYEDHLATGRPLPEETIAYLAALKPLIELRANDDATGASKRATSWREAPLFVVQRGSAGAAADLASDPSARQPSMVNSSVGVSGLLPQSMGLFVRQDQMVQSQ